MRFRAWSRIGSLLTFAALTAVATTANAQAGRTSQQRIPVQKESAGDVARKDSIARADSIAAAEAARRDSVARAEAAARQDSIAKAEAARRDSITRADSIAAAAAAAAAAEAARRDSIARDDSLRALQRAQAELAKRGFVIGLAAGWSAPNGDYGDVFENGWNVTLPIGWHRQGSRFGFRGDIAYDSHGGKSVTATTAPPVVSNPIEGPVVNPLENESTYDLKDGNVWSGNLDLVLDLAQWGKNRLGAFYLLGGGGVHFFNKKEVTVTPISGGVAQSYETDTQTKWGLNGGIGLAFEIGRTAMFLESRYFTAYTDEANSDWVPIILGVKFR